MIGTWLTQVARMWLVYRLTHSALLLGVVVSVAVSALSRVGVFGGWETRVLDTFVFWRDRVQAPEVILVTIDDAGRVFRLIDDARAQAIADSDVR